MDVKQGYFGSRLSVSLSIAALAHSALMIRAHACNGGTRRAHGIFNLLCQIHMSG